MIEERQIGVKEARLGLSIILGLLVALGAVATYRMREQSQTTTAQSQPREPSSILRITNPEQPAAPTDSAVQQASHPAQWLRPEEIATDNPVAPAVRYAPSGMP